MKTTGVLLAAALLAANAAWAQDAGRSATTTTTTAGTGASTARSSTGLRMPHQSGFWNYVGIGAGVSDFNDACIGGRSCDRHDTAWKIYGGGKFNETFGFEVGWVEMGRTEIGGGSLEARGLNLSLLAGFPVGMNSGVHAKLGTTYGTAETNGIAGLNSGRNRDWGMSYGIGGSIGLNPNLQLRLDWDRYRFDFNGGNRDVDALMLGMQVKF